ncbi:MAG TPA: polysaccharide deacetylase family protein [Gaiellaceae bacterium]|nr:polysaccharide deacetylase family protein [Gaiellaceae bacterium]
MAKILLSFDFEDWHQLVHRGLGHESWDTRGHALERQTAAIFELLAELGARATFFVLGITAERYPDLVRAIAAGGHDLACHGHDHRRVRTQSRDEFKGDVERCAELVEHLAGKRPVGYRAPAFSITRETPWAYDVLAELGFRYDSSQYDSPRIPQRIRGVPRTPYRLELNEGREIWEYPVTVWPVRGRPVPMGGGAYWRALPTSVLRKALREVTAQNSYPVLYFHPYELDPQPLRAALPESPTPKQRALAAWKSVQRNPGRRLVADRIRAIAREYTLTSYEEAHGEVVERYGARPRSLSRAGVVV